jgi:hypothetical protein
MADGTLFVKVASTQGTPEDYLLSGAASQDLLAVRADYDGGGAAGDFLPVVQIVNEADEVMLTFVGEQVAAGDSVTVTFAPFLRGQTSTTPGGSGWQFDTYPQAGDWGVVETTSTLDAPTTADLEARYPGAPAGTFSGAETLFLVSGSAAFQVYAPAAGQINLTTDTFGVVRVTSYQIFLVGDQVEISGDQGVLVQATGGSDLELQADTGLGGNVTMPQLPIVNPGGSGRLWNDGGVVSIT